MPGHVIRLNLECSFVRLQDGSFQMLNTNIQHRQTVYFCTKSTKSTRDVLLTTLGRSCSRFPSLL